MRRALALIVLVLVLAAAGVFVWLRGRGPSSVSGPARPNIVLVTIDTLRADRVGRGLTPAIDALADAGIRFERARATVPLTLPSHVTLMTGTLPTVHGVRENGVVFRPGPGTATLARALREGGYRTGAFVGAYVLNGRFGLADGFDTYDDRVRADPALGTRLEAERRGGEVVDAALEWLRQAPSPFFLWVHLYDPHAPYDPPVEFRARAGGDPYDGEVAYADAQVARLVEALRQRGTFDSTLVAVAGDHGEGLGEHGEATHGMLAYDSTLRVPLILSGAGARPGRVTAPVSLADVAMSIRKRAGLAVPAGAEIVDLFGRIDSDRDVYAETMYPRTAGWHPVTVVAGERWKLLLTSEPELYDLQADPQETKNLAPDRASTVQGMTARLKELEAAGAPAATAALPPEASERLRALGYVSGGARTSVGSDAPNPARVIEAWTEFERALSSVNAGRAADALPALKALTVRFPRAAVFFGTYARALKDTGRPQEALAVYREAIANSEGDPALFHDLAVAAREAGDLVEAERAEQAALALDDDNPAALNGLGLVYVDTGRHADAAAVFERAARADPSNPSYWTNLGNARRAANDLPAAESAYRRALEADPSYPDAANGLGVLLVQRGAPADAIRWLELALERAPAFHEARLNLGIAYQESGNRQKAAEMYRQLLAAPSAGKREKQAARDLLSRLAR